MGSYGIGPTRLVPALIEAFHDANGILWPKSVAPFDLGLVNMKPGEHAVDAACEALYSQLSNAGVEILYDDTDARAGAKFATMDLIGLPYQVIVGPRGIQDNQIEIKDRASGERVTLTPEATMNRILSEFPV
jgi:prolyl-tRNA synthetase